MPLQKIISFFRRQPAPRQDAWENPYTGYGTWRDKTMHGSHVLGARLSDEELSSLYYTEDIAAKLVEKRPEEAFRRGYKLTDADDERRAAELLDRGKRLDVDAKMQEAWTWARCYGGSLLVLGIDGGNPSTPLRPEQVRDIRWINVVDRRFVQVEKTYDDPMAPNFGEPEIYKISDGSSTTIHESRVIRFDGVRVDIRKRREFGGWGYSVLQRPYDVIRQFATAFAAAGVLVAEASQAVFKLKGLHQMIASGEKERLQTRMQMVDMSRSASRSVLLDADGEEFQRIDTTFSGLPEIMDRFAARLSAAADMPVTLLMGTTPAGDNATGASDFKHWYDSIAGNQEKDLTPKLLRFYTLLSRGRAEKLRVAWLPLLQPTDRELAEIEKLQVDASAVEIANGVLFPEEVALARYGKSTNGEIEINENARKRSLEDAQSFTEQTTEARAAEFDPTQLAVLGLGQTVSPLVAAALLGTQPGSQPSNPPNTGIPETPPVPQEPQEP